MFKEGQRHGEGTLFYSNGARYEGQWQQGKKHGRGVYVFEDGHVFSGHFLDDRPVLATGAVLGVASTFPGQAARSTSCCATGSGPEQQQRFSTEPTAALDELQGSITSTDTQAVPAPAAPSAAKVQDGRKSGKERTKGTGAVNTAQAASAATKAASKSSKAVADKPSATATTARASTAGSTSSAASAATAKGSNAVGGSQAAGGSSTASASSGPCFGPATCVMQLYIADLLQCYEGQPDAVYKPVSNLLVGYNTELRLLYDKYR